MNGNSVGRHTGDAPVKRFPTHFIRQPNSVFTQLAHLLALVDDSSRTSYPSSPPLRRRFSSILPDNQHPSQYTRHLSQQSNCKKLSVLNLEAGIVHGSSDGLAEDDGERLSMKACAREVQTLGCRRLRTLA